MFRIILNEFRLAAGLRLAGACLAMLLVTLTAWAQEPLFLRAHGVQLLWNGTAAAAVVGFLFCDLIWLQGAAARRRWGRGLAGPSWLLAAVIALTALGGILLCFGIFVCFSLDWMSGSTGYSDVRPTSLLFSWLGLTLPLIALSPGLSVAPGSAAGRLLAAVLVLVLTACICPTPQSLDLGATFASLMPALLATAGSLLLSAALLRTNTI